MSTRREFIKNMMALSGSAGMAWSLPKSIRRAISIDPEEGSTFMDAEHVVILMQENRSFDHCFGRLQGVRGFNDPRAITLPDSNPVWLQTSEDGATYNPFRFDINDTNITWMGSVPHSRASQIDANHEGKYDRWIETKRSHHDKYADMPLTMGYYTREDIPFNYALADAFTVCDQNFCSGMTSTWPNRLFFWTGAVRGEGSGDAKAYMRNNIPWGEAHWKAMPEWLEERDISWRIYQNDISTGGGYKGQERAWLANFGLNPLEHLTQYNVRFSQRYVKTLQRQVEELPQEISELEHRIRSISSKDKEYNKVKRAIDKKKQVLSEAKSGLEKWGREAFEELSQTQKNLYNKAFTINNGDPDYLDLTTLNYTKDGEERELPIPKGDILHQFRKDVQSSNLPMVSWLAPPQNFSDHPSAPWYGSWYTSEVLNILTENPEVWKKTIFIYTYDENDGYFDHVPPYTAPNPKDQGTGKCSASINVTGEEWVDREQELEDGLSKRQARSGPTGLGYRVPMIIASPWSRGGRVCSEVFDHTSTLQFLEQFIRGKTDDPINVDNISDWRRTVCGDLTSVFQDEQKDDPADISYLDKVPYIEKIYDAKFKKEPSDFKPLSEEQIDKIRKDPTDASLMPGQEQGVRPSCGLPYELYVEGNLTNDREELSLWMKAGDDIFGSEAAGSPFKVYAPQKYRSRKREENGKQAFEKARSWDYAVSAGDELTDQYPLDSFKGKQYFLRVYGPNGFFRELKGSSADPSITIECRYQRQLGSSQKLTGNIELTLTSSEEQPKLINIEDPSYGHDPLKRTLSAGGKETIVLNLERTYGWYDFIITAEGDELFKRQYAGRVETGKESYSDPAMGKQATAGL